MMSTETVIQLVGIVLGSNVLIEIIKMIANRHNSPERIALRVLCEVELDKRLHEWLHSDVRTADDWRIIENLYTSYKALDGNGEITKLYEEAKQIPTTE